jgi:hypothetical protein
MTEEHAVVTPTSKKKVTTIFVMKKKAKSKVPMAKKPTKKVQEEKMPADINSSAEELMEAAQAIEKCQEEARGRGCQGCGVQDESPEIPYIVLLETGQ